MQHVAGNYVRGAGGDGGAATSAQLNRPLGVCVDAQGYIHVVDTGNNYVRYITLVQNTIQPWAGTAQSPGFSGDGGLATSAELNAPGQCAIDSVSGTVLIADTGNNRIRSVNVATNVRTRLTTHVVRAHCGTDRRTSCSLDSVPCLYFARTPPTHTPLHLWRRCLALQIITTIAGDGNDAFSGDGGPATLASIFAPSGVAVAPGGGFFIADSSNNRVRFVSASGIISTIAGNGIASYSGDGGPASLAELATPYHISTDSFGTLYIADSDNNR